MNLKPQDHHKEKPAYIYLRQSTMGQVRHHRESTERQYALRNKALELGWRPEMITMLDGDLGLSGTQSTNREDFKTLVADVSMAKVGAVFALEASRLSRSSTDWHRLLELCSITGTLIIDEDGCYDPSDFNDQLLLGLKGTMSQAELHFIRARLQGGKLNKAKKGELRFPLPVGLCYDDTNRVILDLDEEVRGAVRLLFDIFKETGSAYAVVQHFGRNNLRFPKRAYGGAWNGKLFWGPLTHARVLGVLKNPSYSGVYVYGRYKYKKSLSNEGKIRFNIVKLPMPLWKVTIKDHHEAYISWDEYIENQKTLERNRTNGEETMLSGAAREGLALLQGLLICGTCGRGVYVRYTGNRGIYPCYQCTWRKRDGLSRTYCVSIRCDIIDNVITKRILEVLEPTQIDIAIKAVEELERRNSTIDRQWQMKIQRAEYEAQLAQRRYEEVDPSNRLVAGTLEKRWNDALIELDQIGKQYTKYKEKQGLTFSQEQKAKVLSLAKNLPRLWNASSTKARDRKRILRLLIKDITIEKRNGDRKAILHIRWQGGATEDIEIEMPPKIMDKQRFPEEFVQRVKLLAKDHSDKQIAEVFNKEGLKNTEGKPLTVDSIKWIRYKHSIPSPQLKHPEELTVRQVAERFGVSHHVVYYWIERKIIKTRRLDNGYPYWIMINPDQEQKLSQWVKNSTRISRNSESLKHTEGGAL